MVLAKSHVNGGHVIIDGHAVNFTFDSHVVHPLFKHFDGLSVFPMSSWIQDGVWFDVNQ